MKNQEFWAAPCWSIEKFLENREDKGIEGLISLDDREIKARFGVSREQVLSNHIAGVITQVVKNGEWWEIWVKV